jgi:hypothetical protein
MLTHNPTLLINEIDEEAVYKALRKVKDKSTAGPDGIPAFFYCFCLSFNRSLQSFTGDKHISSLVEKVLNKSHA